MTGEMRIEMVVVDFVVDVNCGVEAGRICGKGDDGICGINGGSLGIPLSL